MSKYHRRKKVTGGKHSTDSGIVAGDDGLSTAWLKRFTPKGSVRLYTVQTDANGDGDSAPKYRTVSPDELFRSEKDKNDDKVNGNAVNGESKDTNEADSKQSRYRKNREMEEEKKERKRKQQEEAEKLKEKEKADREAAKEKERAEKEAAREKEREERERIKEEKEKRRLQRKKEKYSHAGSSAQIVSKKKRKEERAREKENKKSSKGNDKSSDNGIAVTAVTSDENITEKNYQDEMSSDDKNEDLNGQNEINVSNEEKQGSGDDVKEISPDLKTEDSREEIQKDDTDGEDESTLVQATLTMEDHQIDHETQGIVVTEIANQQENSIIVEDEGKKEIDEGKANHSNITNEPANHTEDITTEEMDVTLTDTETVIEKEAIIAAENFDVSDSPREIEDTARNGEISTKDETDAVPVSHQPIRPADMKIELPTVSDDAKENQQHIEVHVEIKTGDDDDDKIAEQVKEQASDDVQSKRPQSQVMFDEQVVRQIEQKGTEGSVSSRASSAVAVPRTMIQGRSWGSSSRASAKQVLQNVASNGEVGQQRRQAKRKAELVFEFGQRGTSAGRLRRPHGVAVSANNDIIVCDSGNHRVQIFGWDCKYKTKWSPDTLRRRLFSRDRFDPGDVAVTPDNKHFIVTDFSTERLYKVSLETHHSKEFGKSGYKGPWGVAINSHGYIYISYCISNCVVCYTSDGKFVHTIGRKGVGPAEFSYPCYLAINKRDAIIVAEYHNRRVQILNPDGEFMFQIGSSEHFREISGVAVDNFNNVFVADYKCHRVVMYGNDGAFKLCIGDQEDKLDRPEGVAISHDGYIVVSDSGSHGVKIFRHWDVKKLFDSM